MNTDSMKTATIEEEIKPAEHRAMRKYRRIIANLGVILGLTMVIAFALGRDSLRAEVPFAVETPFIYDRWLEQPNLSVTYMWNLFERRDGWYIDNWSEGQIAGVDGFEFGVREVFKMMQTSAQIDTQHNADVWIQLYNVATNDPDGSHDFPPHMNIISYWGESGKEYDGGVNGHFYTTLTGELDPAETWYAWHLGSNCDAGDRNPEVNTWISHVDRSCAVMWQERVTSDGELQLRRGANAPIYTVRSQSPGKMEILRGDEVVRSVERTFHNAWINYPQPYPDGMARVVWEIRDFEAGILTTETITANPETGRFVSHDRVESPLDGSTPVLDLLYLPQLER